MSKIIAVFGSAHIAPDSPDYDQARQVGAALAQAGYQVMTGGYSGIMAAASQGAAEAGGHVIGVVLPTLHLEGERIVNPWVKERITCQTMRERLYYLVERAEAYVAMPGGIGTLQEIAEVLQTTRLGNEPPHPLIIYGDFWRDFLQKLTASPYVPAEHISQLSYVHTPHEVVQTIRDWYTGGFY